MARARLIYIITRWSEKDGEEIVAATLDGDVACRMALALNGKQDGYCYFINKYPNMVRIPSELADDVVI